MRAKKAKRPSQPNFEKTTPHGTMQYLQLFFKLLLQKDKVIVLIALAVLYTTYTSLQASLATIFVEVYGFGQLDAGLIYLPFGFGCACMAYLTGKPSRQ